MNDEEKKAIEILRFSTLIRGRKPENDAVEILLNLIDKQNKVIDEMAKWIDEHEDPFEECHETNISCADVSCRDCIKQYFIRKVEENGENSNRKQTNSND